MLEIVQEALKESEEKCQAIINNIEDGYYEVNLDGNFTYFNDAMTLITGYSRQELIANEQPPDYGRILYQAGL